LQKQWNITFFDDAELCELSVPSMIIDEYHKLPSAFGLLDIFKEES